ncbi:hypothetical protein SAMN07250955_11940 [Arboricoccus pini]|uniref:Uncharacterized protein n=1 Tax=Arboricoccus pini TaxID=1963835 RepID=A0A212S105_9PROT|nr:hypothetical protein [Arboricoccus pini]SNB78769.1 hypothetical protein SAMN07250955_11940 [Arboricoccus pini]
MVHVADAASVFSIELDPKVIEIGDKAVALVAAGRVLLCDRDAWLEREAHKALVAAAEQLVLVVPLEVRDCL